MDLFNSADFDHVQSTLIELLGEHEAFVHG